MQMSVQILPDGAIRIVTGKIEDAEHKKADELIDFFKEKTSTCVTEQLHAGHGHQHDHTHDQQHTHEHGH